MSIEAGLQRYEALNDQIRAELSKKSRITVKDVNGQRYIGCALDSGKSIEIHGTPGNDLACYLNGGKIVVYGSGQDAVGDTMNEGRIVIRGNIGDAAGYAMRGGKIYVKGNAGYRAGIHMKAYQDKFPVMVIGGVAGSFLGEYQAGGVIVVLGIDKGERPVVGNFPGTGMHGGKMFLRGSCRGIRFPSQVTVRVADEHDMNELRGYISEYCMIFGFDISEILGSENRCMWLIELKAG